MSTTAEAAVRNGVDTTVLFGTLDAIKADPSIAKFQFRARNRWIDARTTARRSAASMRRTRKTRLAPSRFDRRRRAGDPARHRYRAQSRRVPAPRARGLPDDLARLRRAAARGVELTEVESTLEGDMDVQGALGLSDDYRNGFERIRVTFRVAGNAPEEKLREVVERAKQRSAVFDMVTNGVPVSVDHTAA